jgi:hypothetical protein
MYTKPEPTFILTSKQSKSGLLILMVRILIPKLGKLAKNNIIHDELIESNLLKYLFILLSLENLALPM